MNNRIHFAAMWHEWLKFMLFIGCYALLDYAYFKIPIDLFVNVIYYHGVVEVCAELINWLAPQEQVSAMQNHLLSRKADLEIVRGCDGAGVVFLLVSAIGVFPSKWRWKLFGLSVGLALVYFINLLRISILYFAIAYLPAWFHLLHTYLAPTFMVITACAFFAWWAFSAAYQINDSA